MVDPPPYPPIEPKTFDLIITGTGLPQSIIAAAASASGKTVLHLDHNNFYGSHFSSLSIPDLTTFLNSAPSPPPPAASSTAEFVAVNVTVRPLYSAVDISTFSTGIPEGQDGKFLIDLSGPRVLFCAGEYIDVMVRSGASQYLEFKSIDGSFVWDGNEGKLLSVPDSRAAIFKNKSLVLREKNRLTRFLKMVQVHLEEASRRRTNGDNLEEGEGGGQENGKIGEEDLESPFIDFLTKMELPPKILSIILYALAMADYDQDNKDTCKDLLKTKDGIARLALYQSSVGRFTNTRTAFIYPIYGQGELPQAFCRRAAVKGCIYVLRMPVVAMLIDKSSGKYKGIRLASGQDIFSEKLVLDPSLTVPSSSTSSLDSLHESFNFLCMRDVKQRVARQICITRSSLKPDIANLLAVYPPRSLYPEQITSIRVLQIGGNLAVCPPGMFVLYLSALCDDVHQGKNMLNATVNSLLTCPDSAYTESGSTDQIENVEVKPTLLWSAFYIQELTMGQFDSIISTPMPDGNVDYSDVLSSAMELFQNMYPNEEFFPEAASSENSEHEAGLVLET